MSALGPMPAENRVSEDVGLDGANFHLKSRELEVVEMKAW